MSVLALLLRVIAMIMMGEVLAVALMPPARRRRLLPTVSAGFCIVLAWNAWAAGWPIWVVLAALTGALVAHAADVVARW